MSVNVKDELLFNYSLEQYAKIIGLVQNHKLDTYDLKTWLGSSTGTL